MSIRLSNLKPAEGSTANRKRVGRGPGSGMGSQSGRGHKGQKARSGYKTKFWNEGGQMPLARRVPKRGFTNIFHKEFQVVNVGSLEKLTENVIDRELLLKNHLISSNRAPFKILGEGELTKAITVKANAFSKQALAKIEKAGGKAEVVPC